MKIALVVEESRKNPISQSLNLKKFETWNSKERKNSNFIELSMHQDELHL